MEQLLNFVFKNQNKINNNTKICIKIGKKLGNNIFDVKINKDTCKRILEKIKDNHFKYSIKNKSFRVYKHLDMEYKISPNEETNSSKLIIESEIISINNITYCIFLEKLENLELTQFPNLIEYHDIINSNIINISINNLFYVVISIDETCNGTFQSISIVLDRENIYKDKIRDNLIKIINIVDEHFI